MRLTVLGSGDAFGSGGRLQPGFHFAPNSQSSTKTNTDNFLLDCGTTSLIGMQRAGLAPNDVATIYLSHLHGDHFGGLPWWLLDGQHVSRRTEPLLIAGPPGVEARFVTAAEALYPGSTKAKRRFEMRFVEYEIGARMRIGEAHVVAREVGHPSGAPSCALRLETGGKILAYSGDTEWVDALLPTADGADLFICECYGYDKAAPFHIDWHTLREKLPLITARRLLLTHMSSRMLKHRDKTADPRISLAEDGLVMAF
jgi:ribonuclease BN (tRNA processing enzyme)